LWLIFYSGEKTLFNEEMLLAFFFFLLGAILGSFGNVVIYRLPKNQSVVKPRSHCQSCHTIVAWYDNIPIVSWILLGGKCRSCKASFSIRYPFVEFLTASLFCAAFLQYGLSWTLLEYLIFIFGLVICTFIDFDHMILPDEFTLSGVVLGLAGAWLNPDRSLLESFIGVLLGGGFLWLIAFLYFLFTKNEGMGGGDIKLLAWIGAILGWKAIPFVIMVSALTGSAIGIFIALKTKGGLKTAIPFGPYLALAALVYVLGGQTLALSYFSFFLPGF
jgi:leader peptidase (prepilin peptidase)/N-methyltransferase